MQANTPSGPKRRRRLHRSRLRGEKGGLFFTVPGCAVKKAVCFLPFLTARPKRRPVFYSSWVRGQKGGPFFTILSCAAKTAVCFSPFRAARSKRRRVLHSATPRGCCIGPSFRADYKTKPDTPWKSHRVPGKLRWRPKTPRQTSLASEDAPANFAGVRRRPGKFCCGGRRRLGQIRKRPQTSSVGR